MQLSSTELSWYHCYHYNHATISFVDSALYLQGPAIVASPYGGVNIEEIAKASPSYIYKDGVDITTGIEDKNQHARKVSHQF